MTGELRRGESSLDALSGPVGEGPGVASGVLRSAAGGAPMTQMWPGEGRDIGPWAEPFEGDDGGPAAAWRLSGLGALQNIKHIDWTLDPCIGELCQKNFTV